MRPAPETFSKQSRQDKVHQRKEGKEGPEMVATLQLEAPHPRRKKEAGNVYVMLRSHKPLGKWSIGSSRPTSTS